MHYLSVRACVSVDFGGSMNAGERVCVRVRRTDAVRECWPDMSPLRCARAPHSAIIIMDGKNISGECLRWCGAPIERRAHTHSCKLINGMHTFWAARVCVPNMI